MQNGPLSLDEPLATAEPLMTAGYASYLLNCHTETVQKWAKKGLLRDAGVVFVGKYIMFDPIKFQAWRDSGGDVPRVANSKIQLPRTHGGRGNAGVARRRAGGLRNVTVDAEYTVKRDSAEGDRKPGQGPVGYGPRFLGAGRTVTEAYPWPDTSPNKGL